MTWNPAASSVAVAASMPSPLTPGTCTSVGPSETTSEILSPFWPVPELGLCAITWPVGTVSLFSCEGVTERPSLPSRCVAVSARLPVKSGIEIGWGPLLTTTSTAVLRRSDVPATGSVATTRPTDHRVVVAGHLRAVRQLGALERLLRVVQRLAAYVGHGVALRPGRDDRADRAALEHPVAGRRVGGDDVALLHVFEYAVPVTFMCSPSWSSLACAVAALTSSRPGVTV